MLFITELNAEKNMMTAQVLGILNMREQSLEYRTAFVK